MNYSKVGKLLATSALLLATSAVATSSAFADDVKLTVWSDTARVEVFERYDALDNGVSLDIVTVAVPDVVSKLQLALQAGSEVPDVVWLSGTDMASQLSTRNTNFMMDLSDQVSQDVLDEFLPAANDPCRVNGKLLCLRNDLAHMVLWYNKETVASLGVDVPNTWQEFGAVGAKLSAMGEGYVLGSAAQPALLNIHLNSMGCSVGVPVAGKKDVMKVDLSSDECLEGVAILDGMIADGSLSSFGPWDPEFTEAAKAGKLPMFVGPSWYGEYVLRTTYEVPEGQLTAAVPPKMEGADAPVTWSWGGGAYGAFKDTPHAKEAVDLVVWATADTDNQSKAVTMPAHAASVDLWAAGLKDSGYYADDAWLAAMNEAAAYNRPGYGSSRIDATAATSKVVIPALADGKTLAETLPALADELKNLAQLNGYTVE